MRHWVCCYCGDELMYESPERLHTQSAYHLVDNHLDRILESLSKYKENWDCKADSVDDSAEDVMDSDFIDEALTPICEKCGQNHAISWAKIQAYNP